MSITKDSKYKNLFLGLLFDVIGVVTSSWVVPALGDFADLIWVPLAVWLMTRMYKGKAGQAAGAVTFVEEFIPGLDIVPTFTIMWLYTYVFKGAKKERIIEID